MTTVTLAHAPRVNDSKHNTLANLWVALLCQRIAGIIQLQYEVASQVINRVM